MNALETLITLFNKYRSTNPSPITNPVEITGKLTLASDSSYDNLLIPYINRTGLPINTKVLSVLQYSDTDTHFVAYFEFLPDVVVKVDKIGTTYKVSFNPDAVFWTFDAEKDLLKDYKSNQSKLFKEFKSAATGGTLLTDSRTYNHPGIGKVNNPLSLKKAFAYIQQWL